MYYELYILACLIEQPRYGYEIKKLIADGFRLCTTINNNTLYPLLRRYERLGYTCRELKISEGNPNRFVYTITDSGKKAFLTMLCDFSDDLMNSRDQFFMRLMYFHFLTPPLRKRILAYRRAFLEDGLARCCQERTSTLYQPADSAMQDFHRQLLTSELNLIAAYEQRIQDPVMPID